MAKGLPAIGYKDCAGVNQLIQHSINGILVRREPNHACLILQLEALMADPQLRQKLGERAKATVKRYSEEFALPDWQSLFVKV